LLQFTDEAEQLVRVTAPATVAVLRRHWKRSAPHYRFAFRQVAASTNERTFMTTIVPPGFLCNHNVGVEGAPGQRPTWRALSACAIANSHTVDYLVRGRVGASVNPYLIDPVPLPDLTRALGLLAHSALRLVARHGGFRALWFEQLGDDWREPGKKPFTWPVLGTEEERWEVRSAIDAVVADAYKLNREQYEHILRSFDRASGPNPHTDICLAKFDELKSIGLEAFTRKYDPYWDIPPVESLPEPVIELPIPEAEGDASQQQTNLLGEPAPTDILGNPQLPGRKKGSRGRSRRGR
jgi:hypothetical protein